MKWVGRCSWLRYSQWVLAPGKPNGRVGSLYGRVAVLVAIDHRCWRVWWRSRGARIHRHHRLTKRARKRWVMKTWLWWRWVMRNQWWKRWQRTMIRIRWCHRATVGKCIRWLTMTVQLDRSWRGEVWTIWRAKDVGGRCGSVWLCQSSWRRWTCRCRPHWGRIRRWWWKWWREARHADDSVTDYAEAIVDCSRKILLLLLLLLVRCWCWRCCCCTSRISHKCVTIGCNLGLLIRILAIIGGDVIESITIRPKQLIDSIQKLGNVLHLLGLKVAFCDRSRIRWIMKLFNRSIEVHKKENKTLICWDLRINRNQNESVLVFVIVVKRRPAIMLRESGFRSTLVWSSLYNLAKARNVCYLMLWWCVCVFILQKLDEVESQDRCVHQHHHHHRIGWALTSLPVCVCHYSCLW